MTDTLEIVEESHARRVINLLLGETGNRSFAAESEAELQARIVAEGLDYVYGEIEMPLVPAIQAMTANGICLDVDFLDAMEEDLQQGLAAIKTQIDRIVGYSLNLRDDRRVATYLFEELGLPVLRRTRSGAPSTNADALGQLVHYHAIATLILNYRDFNVHLTWIRNLLRNVNRTSGRIHCALDPLGTATGRFSCANLPLQSVPTLLRDVFIAEPGNLLIEADFSQIELRVLAHYSQDPTLVHAYRGESVDIHQRTAALVLGISYDDVLPEQRNGIGKKVNFAIIYGMTPYGLAGQLGVTETEANSFLERYRHGYSDVFRWSERIKDHAWEFGYVTTLYGRRRRLPEVTSADPYLREQALRQAVNAVIQGTAADINKLALIRLHRGLAADCRLLLTVHDSALLEVPEARAIAVANQVRTIMEMPPPNFSIPIKVKVTAGRNWRDCKMGPALADIKD